MKIVVKIKSKLIVLIWYFETPYIEKPRNTDGRKISFRSLKICAYNRVLVLYSIDQRMSQYEFIFKNNSNIYILSHPKNRNQERRTVERSHLDPWKSVRTTGFQFLIWLLTSRKLKRTTPFYGGMALIISLSTLLEF